MPHSKYLVPAIHASFSWEYQLKLEIELSLKEARAALRELRGFTERDAQSVMRRRAIGIASLLVWLPIGYLWRYFEDEYGREASLLYLGTALLVAASFGIISYFREQRINEYAASGGLTDPATFDFQEDAIIVEAAGIKSEIAWTTIEKVRESADFVFLFLDNAQAVFIPKRLPQSKTVHSKALEICGQRTQ